MSRRSASARHGGGSRGASPRVDPCAQSRRELPFAAPAPRAFFLSLVSSLLSGGLLSGGLLSGGLLSGGLLLLGAGLLGGCAPESPPQAVAWANAALDLSLEPADTAIADLRWRPPAACTQVFRITVDDEYPANAERTLGVAAERSVSTLALDRDPYAKITTTTRTKAKTKSSPRLAADQLWTGRLLFFGPKTEDRELERELFFSGTQVGLASPDAACFERTWDPIEDALALGWPTLPGRLTAVGERWSGGRVESRCNRSACADPITGNGGPEAHDLSCVTMPWRETLEGIYEAEGQRVASIASYWSDGHPHEHGIWSERQALVSVDDGRLLAAEITIHHNRYKITRNLRIEAVDACPGGVPALGGAPSEVPEGAAGTDPGTEADLVRALAALDARKPS